MKKRIDNLDLLKTIAILMVVALHVPLFDFYFADNYEVTKIIQYGLRLICEGVPIFFFVNGFLLFEKKELDLKKHINKIIKLILIMFFWCIVTIIINERIEGILQYQTIRSLLIKTFETKSGSDYTTHFWFIESLVAIYFIYPILWKCYKTDFKIYKMFFIVVGIFTIGLDSLQLLRDIIEANGVDCYAFSNFIWFVDSFKIIADGWPLFYFMLGGFVLFNVDKVKEKQKTLEIIGALSILSSFVYGFYVSCIKNQVYDSTFNYGSIFMVLFVVGLFALTINYKNKGLVINKLVLNISTNTFGIFVLNKIIILLVDNYLYQITYFGRFVSYIVCFVISLAISNIIKKIPYINNIISL